MAATDRTTVNGYLLRNPTLSATLARRDLRGSATGFVGLIAGIALGVAMIAVTGALAALVLDGVRGNAREAVGGDVSLRLFHAPAAEAQRSALSQAGQHSETAELRPLVQGPGETAILVELKAVDDAYPLYGRVVLEPEQSLTQALSADESGWGAAVDPALLDALELKPGEGFRLGEIDVTVTALIRREPGRALRAFSLGPRVMVAREALEASGLAPPGAQVYWYNRVRLDPGLDPGSWIADLERRFPNAGWRIVNAEDGVPGIERTVLFGQVLLTLIGLSVLLIGGSGVAASVKAHLDRKRDTIAVLKCLGAPSATIHGVYLIQVLAASITGILLGLGIAAAIAWGVRPMVTAWLGLGPEQAPALALSPFAAASTFGLLTALLFSLWPLNRARRLSPQHLFRGLVAPVPLRPDKTLVLLTLLCAAGLIALLFAVNALPVITGVFAVAAGLALLSFLALGKAVAWAAASVKPATRRLGGTATAPLLRLALGNLSRPGAATVPLTMALGLSLTLLILVRTVEINAQHHLGETVPAAAPDLVFINIPPEDGEGFEAHLAGLSGIERLRRMPFLHGRMTHVRGVPLHQAPLPRDLAWVERGDRGLSWSDASPPDAELTAGAWWPRDYRGPPLASLDAEIARRLGLEVGDRLTLNVLGEPWETEIANLRRTDWSGLDFDFPILLSPPETMPPHSQIAAIWAEPAALDGIERSVRERFPATPPVRVTDVLGSIEGMVNAIARALNAASLTTVAAALVVLAGVSAAAHRRRVREMVVLKVTGARPRQLLAACLLEFLLVGAAATFIAAALGITAAWGLLRSLPLDGWTFDPMVPASLGGAALSVMAAAALIAAHHALALKPADILRRTSDGA